MAGALRRFLVEADASSGPLTDTKVAQCPLVRCADTLHRIARPVVFRVGFQLHAVHSRLFKGVTQEQQFACGVNMRSPIFPCKPRPTDFKPGVLCADIGIPGASDRFLGVLVDNCEGNTDDVHAVSRIRDVFFGFVDGLHLIRTMARAPHLVVVSGQKKVVRMLGIEGLKANSLTFEHDILGYHNQYVANGVNRNMFTAIYQWRIKPELESEFLRVWHVRTQKIEEHCGSYGARLYKGDDGTYYSIALWPSREGWEAPAMLPDDSEDERVFRASVQEYLGTKTV